ncbi:response regulator transcription factor [Tessaracoccus caeni]|uniref:response regulator transcription factor n=1 Tax=Tessaracoccus caeni TaxID=3031239 RepID=UPI0023DA81EA|nr:response regulator transcription factor [Tessaracoccus caeni]MDF1489202.1 response regulator transcription factor [Tessaracoccus caeni]
MDEQNTHILVVDDEPYIVEMIAMSLRYTGYRVSSAGSGEEALSVAAATPPDLIVLDVMLPDVPGFELLRMLRRTTDAPVLFLTARDAVEDRVHGLTLGADDYVTKPFSLEELAARIAAILRRARGGGVAVGEPDYLRYADLAMDEDGHEVWRNDHHIALSPTEFALLRYLLRNAGRVVSRAQILEHVWHYDFNGDSTVVDSYIRYLRRKVDAFDPPLIETVRGVGYTLRLPRELR